MQYVIGAATVSSLDGTERDSEMDSVETSRTDLDTHANMPVVGCNSYIISKTGKTTEVNAYSPEYESKLIELVDAAVQYDCPYSVETYILVIRNALHVPAMKTNLIPPFMMREAGVQVNDIPKIQVEDPGVDDHSIYFPAQKFRIHLALWGVFSYFSTTKPTAQTLKDCEEIYMITPDQWDPHHDAYAANEESMLDWEGNLVEPKDRKTILLCEVEEDTRIAASASIGAVENRRIDKVFEGYSSDYDGTKPQFQSVPREADEVSSVLAGVNPILNDEFLYARMSQQAELGRFKTSIGSTNATKAEYLVTEDETTVTSTDLDSDDEDDDEDDDEVMDRLFELTTSGEIDLDDIMVSAMHAGKRQGVKPEHLAKIWRIYVDAAKKTLDQTSQNSVRTEDPKLARNYGTNDRMLCYKRISEYFFMDTFFATKKAKKSTRGNTCCQLFVTDKGFVYVVPLRAERDVLSAIKQFAKEICAPDAIIADAARVQTKLAVRQFCHLIGTTLRILEENNPWANKAELYIGIIKEAV